ncbi:UNVERIFIED_CONTAM: hypothetical protein K2H54_005519, partial [Gekko kuhli]
LDPAKVCAGKGAVTLRASLTYEENPSASPTCPQVAQQSESDWRLSPNIDSNGDALPSALASKGYRSVRPNIPSETKPQTPSRPPPPKEESFAWHPRTNTRITHLQPVPIMDCVYLNAPKPSAPNMGGRRDFSSSPRPFIAAPHKSAGLTHTGRVHAGKLLVGSGSLLPDTSSEYQNKQGPAEADPSSGVGLKPNQETRAEKKDATCSATAQTKVIVVPLHQVHPDRGQEADSGTPPPPLDPCPALNEAPKLSGGSGVSGSFTSSGRTPSAYPSTTTVNPTIVLLQHNREQQKRLSSLA